MKSDFTRRTSSNDAPETNNKYYISKTTKNNKGIKGYNTCILEPDANLNVLPNCVGYACGRFNEIYDELTGHSSAKNGFKFGQLNVAAQYFISQARTVGYTSASRAANSRIIISDIPAVGSIIVWKHCNKKGNIIGGHVAIVENVKKESDKKTTIIISESAASGFKWRVYTLSNVATSGEQWKYFYSKKKPDSQGSYYEFLGFMHNPGVSANTALCTSEFKSLDGANVEIKKDFELPITKTLSVKDWADKFSGGAFKKNPFADDEKYIQPQIGTITAKDKGAEKVPDNIKTYTGTPNSFTNAGTNLLTYPSLVESPFVSIKFGDHTFGTYNKTKSNKYSNSYYVKFPNYITGLEVTKVNGMINQYVINMVYQIRAEDDPNFLDKVFSKVGYGGKIYISYGDWTSPALSYREEEAIITNITTKVDFASSKVSYVINATSNALALASSNQNFPARTAKPSDVILETVLDKSTGLYKIFTGMTNKSKILKNHLIASDDQTVYIPAKSNIDPLSYISYLTSYMISNSNKSDSILKDSAYFMTIVDSHDANDMGGTYFKVTKVDANPKTIYSKDTYSVDVGFPGETMVVDFQLNNETTYSLLYKYSEDLYNQNYRYNMDAQGNIVTVYSPDATTSKQYNITTPDRANWWTLVTQFPVTATLTIKGLVRPAMLMTYIRINSMFFGKRHISSGLYVVVKQQDIVDGNGYRTILTLLRIGGDDDYIAK